jgi:hypothetical protein
MASVAPSALHTVLCSVTWWRGHNLSESGTGGYTQVVPAPQSRGPVVLTREVRRER